jgi:hypothetical protein
MIRVPVRDDHELNLGWVETNLAQTGQQHGLN